MENEKILNKIYQDSVASFELSNDKKSLEIEECCDYCYATDLNKQEALKFVEELMEIINQMEE